MHAYMDAYSHRYIHVYIRLYVYVCSVILFDKVMIIGALGPGTLGPRAAHPKEKKIDTCIRSFIQTCIHT